MTSARKFFETTAVDGLEATRSGLPDDVVVVFHIEGPGGGSWQVRARDGLTEVGPVQPGPQDCRVTCTEDDFLGIVDGSVDPTEAFLDGRLSVAGDIGLALRLQRVARR